MTELKPTILVVDDQQSVIESFKVLLEDHYNVITASSGKEALEKVKKEDINLVLLDILMPDLDGIEVLRQIKDLNDELDIIMVTAVKTVKTAIQFMKLGAYDYIIKPFDVDEISASIVKVLEKQKLNREIAYFRSELSKPVMFDNIVGNSEELRQVCDMVSKLTKNDATVLISGESGTGKELIARAIHFNGIRKDNPFIAVDCAAIPENLLESELFGHEKGAFTDATARRIGKFELANTGTIFLDEIGNLKLELQAKILRVLQEKEIQRVGGVKPINIDIRIISATNVDLKKAVERGQFREDLYYRINVVPIYLPPLRNRRKDIPLLIDHFLKIYNKKFKNNIKGISAKALNFLINYRWPGNVRELQNIIERLAALGQDEIIPHRRLPLDILLSAESTNNIKSEERIPLKDARDRFEKQYIISVLEKANWNQTKAAKLLNIHRNTLILKMENLGIKVI
ncbi:MAG: sigma-54-dependent Fis family transcriptional regulator [Elusimicrobia bacterium]|nr:sigma-54-dependent Fis family transcriptional regulator [Elusimicrobiota bacterium]